MRLGRTPALRAPDLVLIVSCLVLILAGPLMSVQEFTEKRADEQFVIQTNQVPEPDISYRPGVMLGLFILLVVVSAAGTIVLVRIVRVKSVRAVSGRLITLLLTGMTVLDLAFMVDGQRFAEASYAARGATVVWAYPVAGVIIAWSALRLAEVERVFAHPPAPPAA